MEKIVIKLDIDDIYNRAMDNWSHSLTNVLTSDIKCLTDIYRDNPEDKFIQGLLKVACKEALNRTLKINDIIDKCNNKMPMSFYLYCRRKDVDGTYIDLMYNELKTIIYFIGDKRKANITTLMLYESISGLMMLCIIEKYLIAITNR